MPALAYVNGLLAQVLTVVVGGSVVGVVVVGVAVVTLASASGQLVHSHVGQGRHSKNGHAIFLSPRNVWGATLFKLLRWAGRPALCALHVSDQSGRI